MPRYCVNLKAIRYESTSLNRIVADKSHRVIVASNFRHLLGCDTIEMYQMKRFTGMERSPLSMSLLLSTWFMLSQ